MLALYLTFNIIPSPLFNNNIVIIGLSFRLLQIRYDQLILTLILIPLK